MVQCSQCVLQHPTNTISPGKMQARDSLKKKKKGVQGLARKEEMDFP